METFTEFHKIIDDHENIKLKIDDDNKDRVLLSSLFRSFENFKDVILYDKESTINLDEVHTFMRCKEFSKMKILNIDDSGEGLSVSRGGD